MIIDFRGLRVVLSSLETIFKPNLVMHSCYNTKYYDLSRSMVNDRK